MSEHKVARGYRVESYGYTLKRWFVVAPNGVEIAECLLWEIGKELLEGEG